MQILSLIYLAAVSVPICLTLWNFITFYRIVIKKEEDRSYCKFLESAAVLLGGTVYYYGYSIMKGITENNWWEQCYNSEKHSIIAREHLPILLIIALFAIAGYLLIRFIPSYKLPPLLAAFGIGGTYFGVAFCIVWCVQTCSDFWLLLYGINCILVLVKAVCILVINRNEEIRNGSFPTKFGKLSAFLDKATNLPWAGFLALIPLLGIVLLLIILFGQEPSSLIKAWTETADWTFSQKTPPQNVPFDAHYLCTVAAGGHRRIVKPLRTGLRHGHRVVVNRQLCIANAFEQVLEEKTPRLHRLVRKIYDSTGYPISKHIKSRLAADIIYFIMKPLEWLFLLFLYASCTHPENRIAVQYPHKSLPYR